MPDRGRRLPTGKVEARDLPHRVCIVSVVVATLAIGGVFILAPRSACASADWGQLPDMVAWEIFAEVVASAGAAGGKELEFETWASDDDIYRKSPPQWPAIEARQAPGDCRQDFDHAAASAAGFPDDGCIFEEARRNWAAYRYIRYT